MDSYSSGNSNGYNYYEMTFQSSNGYKSYNKKSTCQYYTIRMYEIELMLVMDQKSKI